MAPPGLSSSAARSRARGPAAAEEQAQTRRGKLPALSPPEPAPALALWASARLPGYQEEGRKKGRNYPKGQSPAREEPTRGAVCGHRPLSCFMALQWESSGRRKETVDPKGGLEGMGRHPRQTGGEALGMGRDKGRQ